MLSSRNAQHGSIQRQSGTSESRDEAQTRPGPVTARPARPQHFRSRSYLSSLSAVDPRPRNASTLPVEASPPTVTNGVTAHSAKHPERHNGSGEGSVSGLLPKIHLPGYGHRQRQSQELGKRDGIQSALPGVPKEKSQHHLQHLGLNLPAPLKRTNSHRHTRSELTGYTGMASNDGLLHLAATSGNKGMLTRISSNLSSRQPDGKTQHHKPHHQHSASDFHKAWNTAALGAHGLTQNTRPPVRRRATSDPRSPQLQPASSYMQARYGVMPHQDYNPAVEQKQKPMSEVEVLLYKAEKERIETEKKFSTADVQKLNTQLAESNVELQAQLSGSNDAAQNLMRRLDDAHDSLLSTAASLEDTISSFQNLCQQSDQLIKNFEIRTADLDGEMRRTLAKHKKALFQDRGTRVAQLEDRVNRANERAEEMSKRLENCRTIVRNYVEREATKRRAWQGVLKGSLWGLFVISLGLVLGFCLWWYQNYGDIVKHDVHEAIALALDSKGGAGVHGRIHDIVKAQVNDGHGDHVQGLENVPDDVKAVLDDISHRHNASARAINGTATATKQHSTSSSASAAVSQDESSGLDKMFEKLELR